MADFFTRLAERTLGTARIARPDLAPVYSGQSNHDPPEIVSSRDELGIAPRTIQQTDSIQKTIRGPRVPDLDVVNHEVSERASTPVDREQDFFVPAKTLGPFAPSEQENTQQRLELGEIARRSDAPINRMIVPASTSPSITRPAFSEPVNSQFEAREVLLPKAPAQDRPVIKVSIGRIEVRAVTASTASRPKRAAESPRAPIKTLDTYLRERNGGRG